MNHTSNDIKQLLAKVCIYFAREIPAEKMSPEVLKALLPMLVNGTKEKNGYVRANCEMALIAVLRLRIGDEEHQVREELDYRSLNYFLIFLFIFAEMPRIPGSRREGIVERRRKQGLEKSHFAPRGQSRRTRRDDADMKIITDAQFSIKILYTSFFSANESNKQ